MAGGGAGAAGAGATGAGMTGLGQAGTQAQGFGPGVNNFGMQQPQSAQMAPTTGYGGSFVGSAGAGALPPGLQGQQNQQSMMAVQQQPYGMGGSMQGQIYRPAPQQQPYSNPYAGMMGGFNPYGGRPARDFGGMGGGFNPFGGPQMEVQAPPPGFRGQTLANGQPAPQSGRTEEDWNRFAASAKFAPGTDMEQAKQNWMAQQPRSMQDVMSSIRNKPQVQQTFGQQIPIGMGGYQSPFRGGMGGYDMGGGYQSPFRGGMGGYGGMGPYTAGGMGGWNGYQGPMAPGLGGGMMPAYLAQMS